MYTSGLTDKYGSPLISKRKADESYTQKPITNGDSKFHGNTDLLNFSDGVLYYIDGSSTKMDLNELETSVSMFTNCTNLIGFTNDLRKVKTADFMFYNTSICEFIGDLSSLESAESMFYGLNNINLITFIGDLSSLKMGREMFANQKNLKTIDSDFGALENAKKMFDGCHLSLSSIQNISETIKDISGIEYADVSEKSFNLILNFTGDETGDWTLEDFEIGVELIKKIREKGWIVTILSYYDFVNFAKSETPVVYNI